MALGTIKWYDPNRGFGFIQPDYDGEVLFADEVQSKAGLVLKFKVGMRVRYKVSKLKIGSQAKDIEISQSDIM
ncbi:cold-shock protein [Pedobacter rhizosphaerae]|uniref:Cold shock protein (Beta-ribbon, CspA family) n=1 Tax=Pedobacter rhizosphaerae TaxID=390241 RepID=A0A1H9VK76_9SPHI|nr:cold shock domain-containing protein [Pedobacter rhizosphaerae]SES22176.1 cold shock protein (beta-ribbon, CspA family) [Pedobacter rhizosphaerae]